MQTIADIRRERLSWEMDRRRFNIQQLADAVERSHSQMSQVLGQAKHSSSGKRRVIGDKLARHIEEKLGLPVGALDTPLVGNVTTAERDKQVAQQVSLNSLTVPRKPYSWGELMKLSELPVVFEAVLPDDAMAPELPVGTKVEFDTRETPMFGDKVLIRHGNGGLYCRLYKEALTDAWEGHATNSAFLSYLPTRDSACVVAVMMGHYVPRKRHNA